MAKNMRNRFDLNLNKAQEKITSHLHCEPERGVCDDEWERKEDEAGCSDDEGIAGEGEQPTQQDTHQVPEQRDHLDGWQYTIMMLTTMLYVWPIVE